MNNNYLALVAASTCLVLTACGTAGEAATNCDWGSARLMPTSAPPIPSEQEGDLAEALLGSWQHTYTITGGGAPEPLNDTTDIRFVFPGGDAIVYCQHITGVVQVGPNENAATFTLDGTEIGLPTSAGYNAAAWSQDVMLWDNNTIPGEQYVLQRR